MCSPSSGVEVLWLEQAAAEVPEDDEWLGDRERQVLRGLRFAKRRADWRLGRWTAKRTVAAGLNIGDMRKIEILAAANGAPEAWIRENRAPVSLSLSHSAGRAMCCVAQDGIALGCDLEWIEPRSPSFASDTLTSEELRVIESLPPASGAPSAPSAVDQTVAINLYWSAKESALKALGEGLRLDTRSVRVVADAREGACAPAGSRDGWRELRVSQESGRVFTGWWQLAVFGSHICQNPADVGQQGFVRTIVASRAIRPTSARGGQMWGTISSRWSASRG